MFEGSMSMSLSTLNSSLFLMSSKIGTLQRRTRPSQYVIAQSSSPLLVQSDDQSGNFPESRKIPGSAGASLVNRDDTIGIIGGVSVPSTLNFLQKLVVYSTRDADETCPPFVVCNDPILNEELMFHVSLHSLKTKAHQIQIGQGQVVESLRHKREFLEQSGARCIVMPCHVSHAWHGQVSEGCSTLFLHAGECVARELKEAKLRPLEAGSCVRIGVLATEATLSAGFYQQKLQNQGLEVVLPDKATREHIIIPAIESLNRRDMEGARNLLRIGIQLLLVRAVNVVIIGSDEMLGILPDDDPLLRKCVDPMDALARSAVKWARVSGPNKVHDIT